MLKIQTAGRRGNTADAVTTALARMRSGERACIVARSERAANALAARLRDHGLVVLQGGRYLEIDPTDVLH